MNLRYAPDDLVVKAAGAKKIRVIEIVPQPDRDQGNSCLTEN